MLASLLGSMAGFLGQGGGFWLPEAASKTAEPVDALFNFVLWICIFFFVLICVLMVLFVMRFRRQRPDEEALSQVEHNSALEITWTVIPLALAIAIFWMGFKGYMDLATPPANSMSVQVQAQKWSWLFSYPNGVSAAELHVPEDTPVKLTMSSSDVLHSFFVPAFRIKQDVVPGRYTTVWFHPTRTGEFQVYCTEYCGKGHSDMLSKVIVHSRTDYDKWMDEEGNFIDKMPAPEAGAKVFQKYGCKQCHSVDGAGGTGPTFKGLWGIDQPLTTGAKVKVDENYVRESILQPQAKIAAGYEPVMPTFQGRMNDKEIGVLIEYLKTLK